MGRSPCCDESGLKKGPWTTEEDEILVNYIQKNGHGSWRALPKNAGLNRCGKSCRLRWTNYLRPDIKRGKFTPEEEQTILNLHGILGNKWSAIASHLPGRTDNEIKNFWNTHLKKKLIQMGFDPMTHRPRTDLFATLPQLLALANLKELLDHQSLEDHAVRLQAEAMAKLQYLQLLLQTPSNYDLSLLTTNPNSTPMNTNKFNSDMETLKLLTSLAQSESSVIPSSDGSGSSLHDSFSFPELQKNPLNFENPNLNKPVGNICHVQEPELSPVVSHEDNGSVNSIWQLPPLFSTDGLVANPSMEVRSNSIEWPDFNDFDLSGIDGLMS